MSHTRKFSLRMVKASTNKKNLIKILGDVLNEHGLQDEAVHDFQFGPEVDVSSIKIHLKDSQPWLVAALDNFMSIGTGFILPAFEADLNKAGKNFVDSYIRDWVKELETHAKKDAEDILSVGIDSNRVLIFEIYCRLFTQALRFDSKSKMPREEWLNVMQTLKQRLVNPHHTHPVELDPKFCEILTTMHERWHDKVTPLINRIEDLKKAEIVIKQNTAYIEALQKQIMRFIVVELVNEEDASHNWTCRLNEMSSLMETLEQCEMSWIDRYKKKNKRSILASTSNVALLMDGKTTTIDDNNKLHVSLQQVDLVAIDALTIDQAARQNWVILNANNERVRQLYAFLNWTIAIDGMIDYLGTMVVCAGYMPFLLGNLKLNNIDDMLVKHAKVFKLLTHSDFLRKINGTKLRTEMTKFISEIQGIRLSNLHAFHELNDEEFLKNITQSFSDSLKGIMNYGQILNCPITSAIPSSIMQAIPDFKKLPNTDRKKSLADMRNDGSVSSATALAKMTTPLLSHKYEDDQQQLLLENSESSAHFRYPKMQVGYIKSFFSDQNLSNLNHLNNFSNNQFFNDSCAFVAEVRKVVIHFEESVLNGKSASGLSDLTREYWIRRSEEVYWLKYLCVQTMITGDVSSLVMFCQFMISDPYYCALLNFSAYEYDRQPKEIKSILKNYANNPGMKLFQTAIFSKILDENHELSLQYQHEHMELQNTKNELSIVKKEHATEKKSLVAQHNSEISKIEEQANKEIKARDVIIDEQADKITSLEAENIATNAKIKSILDKLKAQQEAMEDQSEKTNQRFEKMEARFASERDEVAKANADGINSTNARHETQVKTLQATIDSLREENKSLLRSQSLFNTPSSNGSASSEVNGPILEKQTGM